MDKRINPKVTESPPTNTTHTLTNTYTNTNTTYLIPPGLTPIIYQFNAHADPDLIQTGTSPKYIAHHEGVLRVKGFTQVWPRALRYTSAPAPAPARSFRASRSVSTQSPRRAHHRLVAHCPSHATAQKDEGWPPYPASHRADSRQRSPGEKIPCFLRYCGSHH